jgi:hypothetical protein
MIDLIKLLVLRTGYTSQKLPELVFFVENVLIKMNNNKTYQALQEMTQEIQVKLENFRLSLVAAEDGLSASKKKKEAAYDSLIVSLHYLSSGLEFYSKGDANFITEAGMQVQGVKKGKRNNLTTMVPPQLTKVAASKIPGHVDLEYTSIPGTKMYGFEYSEDQITWKNGQYSHVTSGSIMIPTRKDVWIRVRAIGVHKVQSEFSAAAQIFIA